MKSGVEIRVRFGVALLHRVGTGLAHQSVGAQHADHRVQIGVVGADHAAFDRAHVMGVVEREVRGEPEGPELAVAEGGAVRLADVLDQRNAPLLQRVEQAIAERVVAEHVGQEDGARARRQLRDHLLVVHAERARIDVDEDRRESRVQHRGDVRDPGECRHDHLAGAVAMPQRGQRDQVRRRARVHEHRVPHAQPRRPFLLEELHLLRLGEDRVVGLQEADHRLQVVARDVVAHQRPRHQNGPRNTTSFASGFATGSQPVARPATRSLAAAAIVSAFA